MDDPRLSHMYAKLFKRNMAKRRQRVVRWTEENRSSILVFSVILALAIFAAGYIAHIHGRFRRLKTELKSMGNTPVELPPMPGGQEAMVMQRTLLAEGTMPEFLSATLLPGRGLNVLQIMMSIPGRGAIPLLAAPSLEDAATAMTGTGADSAGLMSLRMGSPIEAPWGGRVLGNGTSAGPLMAEWHGRQFSLPVTAEHDGVVASEGGLLLKQETDTVKHNVMPDGGTVQGSFAASNFGGRWPSSTSVAVSALLSSRAFEMRLVARNEGKEAVPVGLGWEPRLLLPSGGRAGVKLRLPGANHMEMRDGRASGRLTDVGGTALDYMDRGGRAMHEVTLDDTFTGLRSGFLDTGPILEIRDERSGIGLRMTALSQQIRAVHVRSLPNESVMEVGFQTNYDDPFSRNWSGEPEPAIHVLQPGQTLQWRVRLELFQLRDMERPVL